MDRPEGDPEIELLAPIRAQPRVDPAGGQLAKRADQRGHVRIRVDRRLRLPHPERVQVLEIQTLLDRGNEQDRDGRGCESGARARLLRPQESEDGAPADADDHDRGDVHAADEPVEEERLLKGEERCERAERSPPEVEHQPHDEEDEREDRGGRAQADGGDNSDSQEDGEHRKATVVGELPAEEPSEDRRSAEGRVLLRLQVRARVLEPALEDVRQPHPGGERESDRTGAGETRDPDERIRLVYPPHEEERRAHDHHVGVEQMREHEDREHDGGPPKARPVADKAP